MHDAEDAQRQGLQQRLGQDAEFNADKAEKQAAGAQAEGDGEAHEQEDDQSRKHDGRDVVCQKFHGGLLDQAALALAAFSSASR